MISRNIFLEQFLLHSKLLGILCTARPVTILNILENGVASAAQSLSFSLAVHTHKIPPKSGNFLQYCNVGCIIYRPKIVILDTDFIMIFFLNLFSISRHLWMPPPQTTTIPVFSFCTQHLRHFSLLKANVFQEKRGSPRYLVLDIQKQF